MNEHIKTELYQLIDRCDNEILLEEAKAVLQSTLIKDWWDDLTEEEKNLVLESETEYSKGNFISHSNLMKDFEKWKKK